MLIDKERIQQKSLLDSEKLTDLSNWEELFNERELDEIKFNRIYAKGFGHGTGGHNARITMAKMAELLDLLQ